LTRSGLIGPGQRKSIQPIAQRQQSSYDQLHHFISAAIWDAAPLETELAAQADRLVGGPDAVLVIDDTALPKKGWQTPAAFAQTFTPQRGLPLRHPQSSAPAPVAQPAQIGKTQTRSLAHAG